VRTRSHPRRLAWLAGRHPSGDRERLIHDVVAETGLDPAEVRAELAEIEGHARRYGPPTLEQFVHRCAMELGLPEAELWADLADVTGGVAR